MELLILFIILNVANVIMQTIKGIVTLKGGKYTAALVNAITFGLYTFVIIYMNVDINIWLKAFIVAVSNFVGVFIVKWVEEKREKEQLWCVEATVRECDFYSGILGYLKSHDIPFSVTKIESKKLVPMNLVKIYCYTKEQSKLTRKILNNYGAKYFASESKVL